MVDSVVAATGGLRFAVSGAHPAAGDSSAEDAAKAQRLQRACQEFESLFLAHLVKTMRASTEALGAEEGTAGSGLMTEIVDEHLARALAKGGGVGLAQMLEAKYGDTKSSSTDGRVNQPEVPRRRVVVSRAFTEGAKKSESGISLQLNRFSDIVSRAAKAFNLKPELLKAVISQESGGQPHAVSPKGAKGLMQLMDETSRELGVRNPFDPEENVFAGARYLSRLLDRWGGDLNKALAAYNAGPAMVEKYGGVPPFAETRAYVRRILDLVDSEASTREAGSARVP